MTKSKRGTRASPSSLAQFAATDEEITAIYATARQKSNEIAALNVQQRVAFLTRLKQVILSRKDTILDAVQNETGKSRTDAFVAEIFAVLDHLDFLEKYSAKYLADKRARTPLVLFGKKSWVYLEPMGTVLVISPWNYPFHLSIMPLTTAFVCGNAVVLKPSEYTPLHGLVESLLMDAGFPQGWVQVAYGDGETGAKLIEQRPDKIFFTGSVDTGKKVMRQAAEQLIPVELELGGKDPMIVFSDANLERATSGALWGAFTNTGQACTSVERLYVQNDIYEAFKTMLVAKTNLLVLGTDRDGNADVGRMTTPFQVQTVKDHLDDARRRGAKILTGEDWDGVSELIPPIILEDVPEQAKVLHEETFGPVVSLVRFNSEDEVVTLANASEYGLAASVWGGDRQRCERVARRLVTGNVSINNVMLTEGNSGLPFGGTKMSGIGRYRGEFGFQAFSNIKAVIYDGNNAKIEANWFPFDARKYQMFVTVAELLFGGKGISNLFKFLWSALRLEHYANRLGKQGRKPAK